MVKFLSICLLTIITIASTTLALRGELGNFYLPNSEQTLPTGAFESSHERASYAQMLSIYHYGIFNLPIDLADFGSPDVAYYQGQFYSLFPPGVALAMLFGYHFGSFINANTLTAFATFSIFALGSTIFTYLLAKDIFKLSNATSIASALIPICASSLLAYSATPVQHAPATFFLTSSLYAAAKYAQRQQYGFIYATYVLIIYPISIFFDYPNALLLFPVILYLLSSSVSFHKLHRKLQLNLRISIVYAGLFGLGFLALHPIYNLAAFGDWNMISQFMPTRYRGLEDLEQRLATQINRPNHSGFTLFMEERLVTGLNTLMIANDKGLFFYFPIYIFMLVGIYYVARHAQKAGITISAVIIINVLLYASFADPWGGWAFGPRYLIPTMSIGAVLVGYGLTHMRFRFLGKVIASLLFIFSSFVAFMGALTTTMLPPKVEADYLKLDYGIPLVWEYLNANRTGSFVYNNYLATHLSLFDLTSLFVIVLSAIFFTTLIAPEVIYSLRQAATAEINKQYQKETFLDDIFVPIRKAIGQFIIWLGRGVL